MLFPKRSRCDTRHRQLLIDGPSGRASAATLARPAATLTRPAATLTPPRIDASGAASGSSCDEAPQGDPPRQVQRRAEALDAMTRAEVGARVGDGPGAVVGAGVGAAVGTRVGDGTGAVVLDCGPTRCEIFAPGVNKGSGVARLLEHLNVPASEAMALGDAENDVEMLQLVGAGVAMGNALPEVHAEAAAASRCSCCSSGLLGPAAAAALSPPDQPIGGLPSRIVRAAARPHPPSA